MMNICFSYFIFIIIIYSLIQILLNNYRERDNDTNQLSNFLLYVSQLPLQLTRILQVELQYFGASLTCVWILSHSIRCPTLCDPTGSTGSTVHGILQARILEWIVISSSRRSCPPRDETCNSCVSCFGRQVLCHCITWEASTYM